MTLAASVVATVEASALNAMGAKNSIGASLFIPRPWWQVDNDGDEVVHGLVLLDGGYVEKTQSGGVGGSWVKEWKKNLLLASHVPLLHVVSCSYDVILFRKIKFPSLESLKKSMTVESQRFVLRIPPPLYMRLKVEAHKRGKSVNSVITETLEDAVPIDGNDLFASPTIDGPKSLQATLGVRYGDPLDLCVDTLGEACRLVLDDLQRIDYWSQYDKKMLALLLDIQKQVREPRDRLIGLNASTKKQENLNREINASLDVDELLSELLELQKSVKRRRTRELNRQASYVMTQVERVKWDLAAISRLGGKSSSVPDNSPED